MKKNKVLFMIFILVIVLIVLLVCLAIIKKLNKNEDIVNIEEQNEGGIEYNQNQLENFNINIIGITDEIKNSINNIDEMYLKIKEYMYLYGLVDGDELVLNNYNAENDIITLYFSINDSKNTNIKVVIDTINNTTNITQE